MRKNSLRKIFFFISVLVIPFILIFVPFRLFLFNEYFYQYEFEKLNVYDKFASGKPEILLNQTFMFLKGQIDEVDGFNERENLHLMDVKKILEISSVLFAVFAIFIFSSYFYLRKHNKKLLYKEFFYGGIITILFILLLLLFVFINFDFTFTLFHELFFSPGTWMFNPETELLKRLFPDQFFIDYSVFSLVVTFILSVSISVISYFRLRKQ